MTGAVARPLAAFGLEAWQRWGMGRARHNIAGSGLPLRGLGELGLDAGFWEAAWATSPDEHTRALRSEETHV